MSFAHHDSTISAIRAEALFASTLQRTDQPGAQQVRQAISAALAAYGDRGCLALVAQAYGDHPETAVARMLWARTAVSRAFGSSRPEPSLGGPYAGHCIARAA